MAVSLPIDLATDKIAEFCSKWLIHEFALFRSVLREDFGPDSDIDVLVTFSPEATHTVFDLAVMEKELAKILGRKVDLVDRQVVEKSPNYLRRQQILGSAEVIYGA